MPGTTFYVWVCCPWKCGTNTQSGTPSMLDFRFWNLNLGLFIRALPCSLHELTLNRHIELQIQEQQWTPTAAQPPPLQDSWEVKIKSVKIFCKEVQIYNSKDLEPHNCIGTIPETLLQMDTQKKQLQFQSTIITIDSLKTENFSYMTRAPTLT